MDSLGRNLNRIRSARGMSLRDLAEAANVSPSFLSQIENDKTSPPSARSRTSLGVWGPLSPG
ncbi:MAG: hypothetical protein COW34_08090 [Armatimonadetes bacterium CG17_big_fil_post_rev_8_21_14_2_50_66_6]|nr:MAG: hypothetical protein COW34_08090 [Armatimonadetes bacterium CG17_big_fil_post_rev_8_21_14_2_50_66_6]